MLIKKIKVLNKEDYVKKLEYFKPEIKKLLINDLNSIFDGNIKSNDSLKKHLKKTI